MVKSTILVHLKVNFFMSIWLLILRLEHHEEISIFFNGVSVGHLLWCINICQCLNKLAYLSKDSNTVNDGSLYGKYSTIICILTCVCISFFHHTAETGEALRVQVWASSDPNEMAPSGGSGGGLLWDRGGGQWHADWTHWRGDGRLIVHCTQDGWKVSTDKLSSTCCTPFLAKKSGILLTMCI